MALKQTLRQTQKLALTPSMRQSLGLLCLPQSELCEAIEAEARENPFLKVGPPRHQAGSGTGGIYDLAAATVEAPQTLSDFLRLQLAMMTLPAPVLNTALYLVGDLSEEGYLLTAAEETAEEIGIGADLVERAVQALQSCEPTGVAARNLAECLRLQLVELGTAPDVADLLVANLELVAENDWRQLGRQTGLPRPELERLTRLIRTLNPFPAERFGRTARQATPDILVEIGDSGQPDLSAARFLPDVTVDRALLQRARADASAKDYAAQHLERAESLIRAIGYRNRTLLRVAGAIVTHQHRFFAGQTGHISPLTRTQLADTLSLHASTVGRAISGKFLQAGGAVYPFSHFFSRQIPSHNDSLQSAFAVQHLIRALIRQEPDDAPLPDQEIVTRLRADGVDIARRTVAKYRGCMSIPSSFERRRLKAARRTRPEPPGGVKSVKL